MMSKGVQVSSLGMNSKGVVRSASEFKEIYDDVGESFSPYRCPFCEVPYEDRCIVTECVKAPHFKLPNGTDHVNGCNGEAGTQAGAVIKGSSKEPKKTVVGEIELPESFVKRRKVLLVRKAGDDGRGPPPSAAEVERRRRIVASDKTISSHYTTSQLRALVHAYKRLRKVAFDKAIAAKLKQGTAEYNQSFRKTLDSFPLSLYEQKLTYSKAFQGHKLRPWSAERIYFGSGMVSIEGENFVIEDSSSWPMLPKNTVDLVPFKVTVGRTLESDAPTSHAHALLALEKLAASGSKISWYAYGLPKLLHEKYELIVDTLDHVYWTS